MPRIRAGRRSTVTGVAVLLALVTVLSYVITGLAGLRPSRAVVPLYAASASEVAHEAAGNGTWLATGTVPGGDGPHAAMVRQALLDLRALTTPQGAATAGREPLWRYVWPRDAAFVAAAFARTGHRADARAVLGYLQRMPIGPQGFAARYRPDGSGGVPDARGAELDGVGWALWATAQLAAAEPDQAGRQSVIAALTPMIDACSGVALRLTSAGHRLPPPSKDYWEVAEDDVTLGTVAPLLAGLQAAAWLHHAQGRDAVARTETQAAAALADRIRAGFAPGYGRHGDGDDRDAAITFLLPPFTSGVADRAVLRAWRSVQAEASRPGGGLAPGAGWKDDGVSWTPETALFALTCAATGDRACAGRWLNWLAAHRTPAGSLPEKVLADGSPAAVAPLAWTAASVVLSAAELDDSGLPSAGR